MIEMETLNIPRSEETKVEGIETMIDNLGIAKTAVFIKEELSQKEDYLSLKNKMFGKMSAKKIYDEIKK